MVWSQWSPSSYTGSVTRGSYIWESPSYIMGWSHSHPPGSKHGHSCLTYLWNQLKAIDMLNDRSRGCLQNCCYSKWLSMALLHASHPPAQTCGGEDILYMYIFLIFPGHRVLNPITNPYLGPPLGCTLLQSLRKRMLERTYHRMWALAGCLVDWALSESRDNFIIGYLNRSYLQARLKV